MGSSTAEPVTVKVAIVAPSRTVTVAGTDATIELLLDRLMVSPPEGAAELNVTVTVVVPPSTTVDGLMLTDASVGPGIAV